MLGLDTNLIMHHLSIAPSVKLFKKNMRKIHPHIAIFVKEELQILSMLDSYELLIMLLGFQKLYPFQSMINPFVYVLTTKISNFPLPNIDMIGT